MDEPPALQFGLRETGRNYGPRPAAFGVAVNDRGRIALVHVTKPSTDYFDLPGGGLEAGESAEIAVVREFGEETGLIVRCERLLCDSGQFLITTSGKPANNLASYFTMIVEGADHALKTEADHSLLWLAEAEALRRLRHDAHAWAVTTWIRNRPRWP